MAEECQLYDRECIDCGECDMCDLIDGKNCDDCGRCLESTGEYRTVNVKKYYQEIDIKE